MKEMEIREFSVSWGTLWRILAMATLVAVIFVSRDVLVAVLLSIVISSALDPMVDWFERKRIPRLLGTLTIYLLVLLLIAIVFYILVPVGLVEVNSFLANNEGLYEAGNNIASNSGFSIDGTISDLRRQFAGGELNLVELFSHFLGGLILAIVVFVLSFYMTIDRHGVKKFLITIVPIGSQEAVLEVYRRVHRKISSWFVAQLMLSLFVGLAVFIGLWILGVPYSLILGVAAGLFELIPYVGPIFSGGLAVIFALSGSVTLAFYTFLLFILIQQLEAHILVPAMMGRSTNLSPVVVLVSLMIGGSVFGIPGAILAVPAAVTFQEILYYWSNHHNGLVNESSE